MRFFRDHKCLSILFGLCFCLLIKNSSIPYPFNPPTIISLIFDAPKSLFFSELGKVIDVFSSAYVTSLLFFVIVDYYPNKLRENKVIVIIAPDLSNLYRNISELLAMIEYSLRQIGVHSIKTPTDMDILKFSDSQVYCNKGEVRDGRIIWRGTYTYNLVKSCHRLRNAIMNACKTICSIPSFSSCGAELIDIISEIQLSELLEVLPEPNDVLYKAGITEIGIFGLGEGFYQLKNLLVRLKPYVADPYPCILTRATEEDVEKYIRLEIQSLEENLEIAKVIAETARQNYK